ncbi:MAG: hypothetical protein SFT91_03305 [Rickettsiaceae bacterium]|nr:hypothetical protein [Rickettsiaceae bacterium]
MSPQIIELLFFAAIAFFIINKLIAILGSTDEDRPAQNKYGKNSGMKDVTKSGSDWTQNAFIPDFFKPQKNKEINRDLLAHPENEDLVQGLEEIMEKIEKFTPESFLKNAAKAWKMIITALQNKDAEAIEALVDSRFIEHIKDMRESYLHLNLNFLPNMKFSDITFFGNSILIKLIIVADIAGQEEWTFIRNFNQTGSNWFLSNIERPS